MVRCWEKNFELVEKEAAYLLPCRVKELGQDYKWEKWVYSLHLLNQAAIIGIIHVGSHRFAWAWLHKLRCVVATPGRNRLVCGIEVDESYIGGERPGKRGRGATGKALVVIAAEVKGLRIGRIRLRRVTDATVILPGFLR